MIYVLTLICAANIPRESCDTRTARAYHATVEQGVVCGLPYQNSFANSPLAPSETEYLVTKCRARSRQ